MATRRISAFVILLLYVTVDVINCRKSLGSGRRTFSSSRHPPSRPSAPSYRPSYPSHGSGSGTVRPLGIDHNVPHHSATVRPLGFDPPKPSAPLGPPLHNSPYAPGTGRPIGFDISGHNPSGSTHPGQHVGPPKHNTPTGTGRPLGFDTSGHNPSGSTHPGQPVGPPKHNTPTGQNPPPYNPAGYGPPPAYNPAGYGPPPAYNPAGYGNPPAYSPRSYGQGGYHPQGGQPQGGYNPQVGYHPQGSYQPGYHPHGGGSGHTIINNNINHYNSYGGGYGGGYSYSPPVYTSNNVGSSALGFFLGYSLAKVTTPSFLYHNSYNNGPRYDHYTVHHYYHNKENVPAEATIQPNAIVACIGDSGSFCPANTTSLCTNNGAVMCVASATSTVPCSNQQQTNCVKSTIPCKDNKAPECKEANQDNASITIPCISTAKIYGQVSFVNNSIVVSNATINSTSPSPINSTTNVSISNNSTTTETNTNITTTENTTNFTTTTGNTTDVKKEEPQMFCVTILALPASRELTQGEIVINNSKTIFSKFVVKSFGIE